MKLEDGKENGSFKKPAALNNKNQFGHKVRKGEGYAGLESGGGKQMLVRILAASSGFNSMSHFHDDCSSLLSIFVQTMLLHAATSHPVGNGEDIDHRLCRR